MKKALVVLVVSGMLGAQEAGWIETHSDAWRTLSERTRSSEVSERMQAYALLSKVADPRDPAYAELLFDLLDRENEYIGRLSIEGKSPSEGWSEPYYTSLFDQCIEIYERAPTTERFQRLVMGSYGPDSRFVSMMASTAGRHVEWLAARARQSSNPYTREKLTGVLFAWVLRNEAPPRTTSAGVANDWTSTVRP